MNEYKIFYLKLKGDYFRYMAVLRKKELLDTIKEKSLYSLEEQSQLKNEESDAAYESYKAALSQAQLDLTVTHPTRMSLCLNFSIFYADVMELKEEAIKMASECLF